MRKNVDMNIALFEKMGLGNMDFSIVIIVMMVLIIVLLVLVILQMIKLDKLKKTYQKFMTGKNVKSLEKEIINLFEDNKQMKEQIADDKHNIRDIYRKLKKTYQKAAIIHYDAFREMGGKLSFCLALLNEENDGFILNSVHSQSGCYSYVKEIRGGRCEIDLGTEEQNALDEALGLGEYK